MQAREGQVWEAASHMNGERIVVVLESRPAHSRYEECTVHKCFHLTGRRAGRIIEWTERGREWDKGAPGADMQRLV